jgi:ParB/RepB/Spo0J family partition protein
MEHVRLSQSRLPPPLLAHLIPVDAIRPFIRRAREKEGFEQLKESMAEVGLKIPIQVRDMGRDDANGHRYQLICGEGRVLAAQQLGWEYIPALIIEAAPVDIAGRFLAENMIRKSQPWAQKGRMIKAEMARGKTLEQVAKEYHITPELATRYVRVIDKIAQGLEDEVSALGVNDAEALTKLPARGQKIVIEVAQETGQSIKNVVRTAEDVAGESLEKNLGALTKATLLKAFSSLGDQLRRARHALKAIRLHYALGPQNLIRIMRDKGLMKALKEAGIDTRKMDMQFVEALKELDV